MRERAEQPDREEPCEGKFSKESEALRASEAKYRELVEKISDWVWEVDDTFVYTFVSSRSRELFGYEPEEMVGKTPFDMMAPEEAERIKELVAPVFVRHEPITLLENAMLHKDGHPVWVETNGIPLFNEDGDFLGYRGIDREIDTRKQAAELLRYERDLVKRIMETSPVGIVALNREGVITFANAGAEKVLGFEKNKAAGLVYNAPHWKITDYEGAPVPDEDLPFQLVKASGKPVNDVRHAINRPDGQRIFLSINAAPLCTAAGEFDGVVASIEDITEQKRAQEALEYSEINYRTLFENASDAIFIMKDNMFIDCNSRTQTLFGCDKSKIIGHHPWEFSPEFQPDGQISTEKAEKRIRKAYSGQPQIFDWQHKRCDGTVFDAEVSLNRIDMAGEAHLQAFVRDITERKKAVEELRESEKRLRLFVETAPFGAHQYELTADGRLVFSGYNQSANRILGVDHKQFLGKTIEAAFPLLVNTPIPDAYRHVALTGERYEDEQVQYHQGEISGAYEIAAFQTAPRRMAVLFRDITERKKAEVELEQERIFQRMVLDTVPNFIGVKDSESRFLLANKALAAAYGKMPEDLIGKSDADFNPNADEVEWFKRDDQEVIRTRKPRYIPEEKITDSTGLVRWLTTVKVPIIEEDGTCNSLLMATNDITDRKQAEAALQEYQQAITAIVESSQDWIWAMDVNGHHTYSNPAVEKILGYTPEEFQGKGLELLHPEDHAMVEIQWPTWIRERQGWKNVILRWKARDGTYHYLESSAVPIISPENEMLGFRGVDRDITERKQAEEELKQSEENFRLLYNAISDGMFVHPVTPAGEPLNFYDANENACRLLGYTREELLRLTPLEITVLEGKPLVTRQIVSRKDMTFERELIAKDGRRIPVEIHSKYFTLKGQPMIISLVRDISERVAAERAKEQFLMVLSHEIKTPLTSIIGWAQMAQGAPDIIDEALKIILRNANMHRILLERIITLARLLTGKLVTSFEQVDLWEITEKTAERFRPEAAECQTNIILAPPPGPLFIQGEKQLLEQALFELLDNACKFTEKGDRITVSGAMEANAASITVQDTGRGIPPESISELQKPFNQINREELKGGLGIGLALVHGIAEKHNGKLFISSEGPGKGTTITLELPENHVI